MADLDEWEDRIGPLPITVGGERARYWVKKKTKLLNPSHCYDCGGEVTPKDCDGVVVPTCVDCGSQWIDGPTAEALDARAAGVGD